MEKDQRIGSETGRDKAMKDTTSTEAQARLAEDAQVQPTEAPKSGEQPAQQPRGSVFEGIYDQLPDISVRSVDRFIVICLIALAAVIVIGVLKANHVF